MIKLQGIPYDANSSYLRGPAKAPARIREMDRCGSANRFTEYGVEIRPGDAYLDLGDLNFKDDDPEMAYYTIKAACKEALDINTKLFSLGGDHSISFPIIEVYSELYPDLHVLQLDAHGDLYDNFDDNPYSHASPFARLMERDILSSLTQIGVRSLNTHQREQVDRFGVRCIEMKDFSFELLNDLQGPLYISLDMDVLDPAFAPGVSHHEPGGMTTNMLLDIIQTLEVEVVGCDIVELNPDRDFNDMTAMTAYKLMKELMSVML